MNADNTKTLIGVHPGLCPSFARIDRLKPAPPCTRRSLMPLLQHYQEAVGGAAGVAGAGNRHTYVAVAAHVDAAIRTEHQGAADIGAGGAEVSAKETTGKAGLSGRDGSDEDIDAAAPSVKCAHGVEIGGKAVAGEVDIAGAVRFDVIGDFALGAAEVSGVDQEVRRIVGIDDGDKHVGVADGVALRGIGSGREIVGEGEAGEDDVVVGVEGDLADLVVIGAAEIGGVDQGSFNGFGHVHHADDDVDAGDVGVLHFAVVGSFQREIGGSGGDAEVDHAVGTEKEFTLDGKIIRLKITPGIEQGKRLRLKHQGSNGVSGGEKGDLRSEE